MKDKTFFEKVVYILFFPVLALEVALIYLYKFCISPFMPKSCRYTPSCSTYFLEALFEYGAVAGFLVGVKRILRCNPRSTGGFDPVLPSIRGKVKWLI